MSRRTGTRPIGARHWVKVRQGENDAADQQPWRCVACGEAVSHIRRNDCACIRAARAAAPEGAPEEP